LQSTRSGFVIDLSCVIKVQFVVSSDNDDYVFTKNIVMYDLFWIQWLEDEAEAEADTCPRVSTFRFIQLNISHGYM